MSKDDVEYSYGIAKSVQLTMPAAAQLGWDAYVRLLYDRANQAIQHQANKLLHRGNISVGEARDLVESQRNRLVQEFRRPLSPWGRLYSEILKPSNDLPTLERLVAQKGSIEAVITSVGKTRTVVNRIAAVSRVAGPATVILDISFIAVAVRQAPERQKIDIAVTEGTGAVGALGFGMGGAWAGCAALSTFASPSLAIPFIGEITTGTACLIGGIGGGIGFGWLGREAGRSVGHAAFEFTTTLKYR